MLSECQQKAGVCLSLCHRAPKQISESHHSFNTTCSFTMVNTCCFQRYKGTKCGLIRCLKQSPSKCLTSCLSNINWKQDWPASLGNSWVLFICKTMWALSYRHVPPCSRLFSCCSWTPNMTCENQMFNYNYTAILKRSFDLDKSLDGVAAFTWNPKSLSTLSFSITSGVTQSGADMLWRDWTHTHTHTDVRYVCTELFSQNIWAL